MSAVVNPIHLYSPYGEVFMLWHMVAVTLGRALQQQGSNIRGSYRDFTDFPPY